MPEIMGSGAALFDFDGDGDLDLYATPQYAETVALCLAATSRFDEAVQLQERLVSEAEQRGAGERELTRLRENLQRYRSGSLGRLPLDTA